MEVYYPPARTGAETIRWYGELGDRGGDAGVAAQAWMKAGFDDAMTARWLAARCFDPQAARAGRCGRLAGAGGRTYPRRGR